MGLGSLFGEGDLQQLDGDPVKEKHVVDKQVVALWEILWVGDLCTCSCCFFIVLFSCGVGTPQVHTEGADLFTDKAIQFSFHLQSSRFLNIELRNFKLQMNLNVFLLLNYSRSEHKRAHTHKHWRFA